MLVEGARDQNAGPLSFATAAGGKSLYTVRPVG